MEKKLKKILNNFKGKKIGVVGDLMLDHFIWGDIKRISPEAPVPVVLISKESFMPGGAGNTAANISALGGKVFAVGAVGKDAEGKMLLFLLEKNGIKTGGVFAFDKPTTIKTRVVAGARHVVRIDKEDVRLINKNIEKKILSFIRSNIKKWDGIVVSDYAKGVITENLGKNLVELSIKYKKPIVCDVKPENAIFLKNATLMSPNSKESLAIAKANNEIEAGKTIQKQFNCSVLLTRGARGATLFENNKISHFPSTAKKTLDVSGAGDTITAVAALALASGANLEQASLIASHAAGIVVEKPGTAMVNMWELKRRLQI